MPYQLILPFSRVDYRLKIYWVMFGAIGCGGRGKREMGWGDRILGRNGSGGSDRQGPTKERVTYLNRKPTRPAGAKRDYVLADDPMQHKKGKINSCHHAAQLHVLIVSFRARPQR